MHLVRTPATVESLYEQSAKIALDYLAGIGELDEPQSAIEFIGGHVARQIRDGQQSSLILSNRAIDAYRTKRNDAVFHLVE